MYECRTTCIRITWGAFQNACSCMLHPNYLIRISKDGAWESVLNRSHLESSTIQAVISYLDLHYYKICLCPVPPGEDLVTVDFKRDHKSRALELPNNFSYCFYLFLLQLSNELFLCQVGPVLWLLWGFVTQCSSLLLKMPKKWINACKALEPCLAHSKYSVNVSH